LVQPALSIPGSSSYKFLDYPFSSIEENPFSLTNEELHGLRKEFYEPILLQVSLRDFLSYCLAFKKLELSSDFHRFSVSLKHSSVTFDSFFLRPDN